MYRGKREQVTHLTTDLQHNKTQLRATTDKLEALQREMALIKVRTVMESLVIITTSIEGKNVGFFLIMNVFVVVLFFCVGKV